jgi:hypothetical protein
VDLIFEHSFRTSIRYRNAPPFSLKREYKQQTDEPNQTTPPSVLKPPLHQTKPNQLQNHVDAISMLLNPAVATQTQTNCDMTSPSPSKKTHSLEANYAIRRAPKISQNNNPLTSWLSLS